MHYKTPQLIAVIGPESTGKSTLCEELSLTTGFPWVPEMARAYLEMHGPSYTASMVEEIALLQLDAEQKAIKENPNASIIICDTNLVVIAIWMQYAFNYCPAWILESLSQYNYELTLLTNIDFPWQPDPLREHPELRHYFFEEYKAILSKYHIDYQVISGTEVARKDSALKLIQGLIK